jgi:hypothetical protein
VSGYLIDTNVLSEVRKGDRADSGVRRWFAATHGDGLFLSVLTTGEIRAGIERLRRRDVIAADSIDRWLSQVLTMFEDRILPIDIEVAQAWGLAAVPDPLPVIDGLLAATAKVHRLTVVTRNTGHFAPAGVGVVNPFSG